MTAVVVFLKYPTPGKVKTRLAQKIGEVEAAQLYSQMTSLVLSQCLAPLDPSKFTAYLFCDPFLPLGDYEALFGKTGFSLRLQKGADLGGRLANAFFTLLSKYDSVIVMGTDCMEMHAAHLREAAEYLHANTDLVLGPARDGGYYLLAARRYHPELFKNIPWSTSEVFHRTVEEAEKLGLKIHVLPVMNDIDTWEDLQKSELKIKAGKD